MVFTKLNSIPKLNLNTYFAFLTEKRLNFNIFIMIGYCYKWAGICLYVCIKARGKALQKKAYEIFLTFDFFLDFLIDFFDVRDFFSVLPLV